MIRLALIFILTATVSYAQEQSQAKTYFTRQPCDAFEKMFTTMEKYNEQLLFTSDGVQFSAQTGEPSPGAMFFFVNQDTGTWSLISLYSDGMACMVANGTRFEPYTGPTPKL